MLVLSSTEKLPLNFLGMEMSSWKQLQMKKCDEKKREATLLLNYYPETFQQDT